MSQPSVARRVAAGLAALLALACGAPEGGSGPTNGGSDIPASIMLSIAGPLTIVAGTTAPLAATVRAADGHALTTATVSFTSSDPAVAAIADGAITAAKTGSATITAASGSLRATLQVTVLVGPAAQLALRATPAGAIGAPLTPAPVLEVQDKGGNLVANASNVVTAVIGTGGGSLSGTTSVAAVGGVATFSNLVITGAPGPRTLAFSSAGLFSASSAALTLTPAQAPLLLMDTTALALSVPSGATVTRALGIANGGAGPLTSLAVDAPTYDAGQPTGWLTASIAGTASAPQLSLEAGGGVLAPGAYRATVRVSAAGATNSPVTVTVALTVTPSTFLTWGSATEKIRIVDVAGTFTPALSARDGLGQPASAGNVTYASRATSVATVDVAGKITAVGEGMTWVTVTGTSSADSVFVIVPVSATGPVLRSDITTTVAKLGDVAVVNVYLDTRGSAVGAVSIAVGYTANASPVFGAVSFTVAAGAVGASVQPGIIRVTAASAAGFTGQVPLLQFRYTVVRSNASGTIALGVTEIVAVDGTNLLPQTTSTRIPVVVP